MLDSENTTTLIVEEHDEDKTLFLTAQERLKYFGPVNKTVQPLSRRSAPIWQRIRRLLH